MFVANLPNGSAYAAKATMVCFLPLSTRLLPKNETYLFAL